MLLQPQSQTPLKAGKSLTPRQLSCHSHSSDIFQFFSPVHFHPIYSFTPYQVFFFFFFPTITAAARARALLFHPPPALMAVVESSSAAAGPLKGVDSESERQHQLQQQPDTVAQKRTETGLQACTTKARLLFPPPSMQPRQSGPRHRRDESKAQSSATTTTNREEKG